MFFEAVSNGFFKAPTKFDSVVDKYIFEIFYSTNSMKESDV